MAKRLIHLDSNDEVLIELPGNQTVSVLLSCIEPGEQQPEFDFRFPSDLILNCFGAGLRPAKATEHGFNVLEGRQIIVPLEPQQPPHFST
jgi:hypothetical protein